MRSFGDCRTIPPNRRRVARHNGIAHRGLGTAHDFPPPGPVVHSALALLSRLKRPTLLTYHAVFIMRDLAAGLEPCPDDELPLVAVPQRPAPGGKALLSVSPSLPAMAAISRSLAGSYAGLAPVDFCSVLDLPASAKYDGTIEPSPKDCALCQRTRPPILKSCSGARSLPGSSPGICSGMAYFVRASEQGAANLGDPVNFL